MRTRILTVLAGLAVVAAACGGGGQETIVASGEAIVAPLAYEYVSGDRVTYRFDGAVDMTMTVSGTGAMAAGGGGDIELGVDLSGDVTMTTSDGDEPGHTELTIDFNVTGLEVRDFKMDGGDAPISGSDFVDPAEFDFPRTTIVVDEKGNIVSMSVDGQEIPGLASGSGAFGPGGSGLDPGMFLNPAFPEGDLTVGSEWVTSESVDLPGMGTLKTSTTNHVAETINKQGHDLFRIDSTTTMSRLDVDLLDALAEMAASDPTAAAAFGDAGAFLPPGMEMRMVMEPGVFTGTTWFDATSGMVASASMDLPINMSISMNVPGEGTADIDAAMEMTFDITFVERSATA